MALTKEEQREAAERIMAKEPLTDEERQTYDLLMKRPEDYVPPAEGMRRCGVCGAMFQDGAVTALEQFSDHSTTHNPSPAQWVTAHQRIQVGREKVKAAG
jgi:hypothetical protein